MSRNMRYLGNMASWRWVRTPGNPPRAPRIDIKKPKTDQERAPRHLSRLQPDGSVGFLPWSLVWMFGLCHFVVVRLRLSLCERLYSDIFDAPWGRFARVRPPLNNWALWGTAAFIWTTAFGTLGFVANLEQPPSPHQNHRELRAYSDWSLHDPWRTG